MQLSGRKHAVRVNPYKEWNGEPQSETLVLKGYLNEVGWPLIVDSTNHDYPGGSRSLSDVNMIIQPGLALGYRFSNRQFPESEWVQMHHRVLDFVKFLQTPK